LISKDLALEFADHAILPLGSERDEHAHFSYPVPANITLTAVVSASAQFTSGAATFRREAGIARGATDVSIVLPTPALPSTPADGASEVSPATEFRWSPFAGGVHLVIFSGEAAAAPSYYVVTRETSTRIPDLTALGAAFPAGAFYDWFVVGFGPFASVDDYTQTGSLVPPVGRLDESVSDVRFFITR
jgi:hypothetical protein